MAKFIIRIELHDADDGDYQLLNFGMEVQGFALTITSSSGRAYWLPTGVYLRENSDPIEAVYEAAKNAAMVAKKEYSLVVTEAAGLKWRGLRRLA